jgi:hypothetical protein
VRGADFCGAYLVRQHILDQNYLWEFKNESAANRAIYGIWWLTSDCGRSFPRWGLWTAVVAMFYAVVFTQVGIDFGEHPTALSPIYFSIVTLTTLGYGDALPSTMGGQLAVIAEVLTGYVMLGGLLSIFSSKMGRRGS